MSVTPTTQMQLDHGVSEEGSQIGAGFINRLTSEAWTFKVKFERRHILVSESEFFHLPGTKKYKDIALVQVVA